MSREIKFRAWDKIENGMHYSVERVYDGSGSDVDSDSFSYVLDGKIEDDYGYTEENRFSVMQYIGVKDKNGKEIYEGDIVKTNNGRLCKVVWFSSPQYQGWDLEPVETKNPPPKELELWKYLEVVGNFYDNYSCIDEILKAIW